MNQLDQNKEANKKLAKKPQSFQDMKDHKYKKNCYIRNQENESTVRYHFNLIKLAEI